MMTNCNNLSLDQIQEFMMDLGRDGADSGDETDLIMRAMWNNGF